MYIVFLGGGKGAGTVGHLHHPPPTTHLVFYYAHVVWFFLLSSLTFLHTLAQLKIEREREREREQVSGGGGGGRGEAGVNWRARFSVFRAFLFAAITFSIFKRT